MLFVGRAKKVLRIMFFIVCGGLSSNLIAGGQLLQRDIQDTSVHYGKKWNSLQAPINWYLSEDGYPGSTFTNTDLEQIFQSAFDAWQSVPTSNISFNYVGEIPLRNSGIDGINLITFTDDEFVFDSGALAMAIIYTFAEETTITDLNNDLNGDGTPDLVNGIYPAGSIYEADIVFNSSYDFVNTSLDASTDLQAIALHEVGHFSGLSHSVIDGTVMYPFLSNNITSARQLKADDIAYLSNLYPLQPIYSDSFGSISGTVTNGFNGNRILGAHVYALDPVTGKKVVGAYSLEQGDYIIPGLPSANYYVGIEPLNGESKAAAPQLINEVIANTLDTNFATEFYDNNESNIETDAQNAQPVSIVAGGVINNINLVTNTVDVPGVSLVLNAGLNLFAYPVETSEGFTSFDLLVALGSDVDVNSIDKYNPLTGRYQRTAWVNGQVDGENYAIQRGEAYLVHMKVQKQLTFKGAQNCTTVELYKGFNLIGVPCPPAAYSAFSALSAMGSASTLRIMRYNSGDAIFEAATFNAAGIPTGVDFPIVNGEGYIIETLVGKNGVLLPGKDQLFPPFISGVSPGRAVVGASISITGQGFSEEAVKNNVQINGVRAAVSFASPSTLVVQVPSTASTGLVNVTIDDKTSNSLELIVENSFVLEADLKDKDLINGQTVQGVLDVEGEQDRYSFIATKGALVTVAANSITPGVPDLILAIESPTGGILISDNNSGGGTNPLINQFEIPVTGRYTVVVTNVANSGVGRYSMSLDIKNRSSIPSISILKGDFQTGLMGTQLPDKLEIFVSGVSGEAVVGASVTLVTDDSVNVTQGFTAASYALTTNANGIVLVNIDLPDIPGEYNIIIQVPGFEAQTISVASLTRLPAQVIVEGNNPPQDCGGTGCPVGEPLPNPYKLTFLDSNSQPLEGVLVKFNVVSGDGELEGDFSNTKKYTMRSDDQGEVVVTHVLGTRTISAKTGQPIAQIVSAVASIPNSTGPILFSPKSRSGPVSSVQSFKGNYIRMILKSIRFNAIYLVAVDAFGNPVSGADVSVSTDYSVNGNDLTFAPGLADGAFLTEMKTNNDGEFVVQISAGTSNPTITEFGQNFPDVVPYTVVVSIAGKQLKFFVDLDMGPELLIVTSNVTLSPGANVWVGKEAPLPLLFEIVRYQREDSCVKHSTFSYDADAGNWQNDLAGIKLSDLAKVSTTISPNTVNPNVLAYDVEVFRVDGNPEATPSVERPELQGNRNAEFLALKITGGEAKGGAYINVSAFVKKGMEHASSSFCLRDHSRSEYRYNTSVTDPLLQGDIVLASETYGCACVSDNGQSCADWGTGTCPKWESFGFVKPQTLNTTYIFNVVSPRIEINLNDPSPIDSNPDLLPDKRSYSGLDLTGYQVKLNSNTIIDFDNLNNLSLGAYPNYIEIEVDGAPLVHTPEDSIDNILSKNLKFIYYPTASQLNMDELNIIKADGPTDKADNFTDNTQASPKPLPDFEFITP